MKRLKVVTRIGEVLIATVIVLSIGWYVGYAQGNHAAGQQAQQAETPKETPPPTVSELLKLVNEERAKAGVAPLNIDERLDESAQRKADGMVKFNYFDHISPNDRRHGYEYIDDTGVYCKTNSENISLADKGVNTSASAIKGWVSSRPHYEAMVSSKYTLTGFGISGKYIVEHFCQQ